MKAVGGRLRFKGDDAAKPKPKRKRDEEEGGPRTGGAGAAATGAAAAAAPFEVKIEAGTGRLTSSGTTVQGHETNFMTQLSVGDALMITHPMSLVEETKVVRMVLSNTSISISSAFSTDLVSTTAFRFAKAPKTAPDLESEERRKKEKLDALEKESVGTYSSNGGSVFAYRVKKEGAAGGYKIVTESVNNATRGDLLDMRAKKKADRHCY